MAQNTSPSGRSQSVSKALNSLIIKAKTISSSHQSSNGWQRMCDFHQGHWRYKIKLLSLCLWMNTKVSVYPWNGALNNISGWGCGGGLCACSVSLLCLTLCDPMDGSLPGSSVQGFPRQEYWSGLPFPSPGDLSDPWIEPGTPALQVDSLPFEPPGNHGGCGGVRIGSSFLPYSSRRT